MPACPTCGKDLTWIEQYARWYCYAESKYAPRGFAPAPETSGIPLGAPEDHAGHYHCPSCGRELAFIAEYGRYYCYSEQKYAPKDVQPVGGGAPETGAPAEPLAESGGPAHGGVEGAPAAIAGVVEEAAKAEEPGTEQPAAEEPVAEPIEPVAAEPAPVRAEPAPQEPTPAEAEPAEAPEPGPTPEPVPTPESAPPPALGRIADPKGKPNGPKLTRSGVMKAKKAKLMEWCAAYKLDATGTRIQLRDRLLAFMDKHRIDVEDVGIREAAVSAPEPAPAAEEPTAVVEPQPGPAPEPAPQPEALAAAGPPREEAAAEPAPGPAPEEIPEVIPPTVPPEPTAQPEPVPEAAAEPEPEPEGVEPEPVAVPEAVPGPAPVVKPELIAEPEREPEPGVEPGPAQEPGPSRTAAEPTPEARPAEGQPRLETERPSPPGAEPAPEPAPAPPTAAPPPEPVKVEIEKPLPCPNCGKDLTYIAQYDRLYCFSCGRYAPRGYEKWAPGPKPEAVEAPKPSAEAPKPAAVELPKPSVLAAPTPAAPPKVERKVEHPCPTCGREMRYIREYDRWWCDAERRYAPRVKAPCPTCGRELTFIPQYGRYYCYAEQKYAPKDYAAPGLVTVTPVRPAVAAPRVEIEAFTRLEQRVAALEQGVQQTRHRHGGAGAGIGLAAVGFSLLIVWFLFLPGLGPLDRLGLLDPTAIFAQYGPILSLLALIGLVLAMAGVIAGLAGVRRRAAP